MSQREEAGTERLMRDLLREQAAPTNGRPEVERVVLPDDGPQQAAEPLPEQLREVRRDRALAHIAGLLIDSAKMLDPITRLLLARTLAFAALAGAVGLTAYTLVVAEGWERVAVVSAYIIFAIWVVGWCLRKGVQ